MEIVEEIWKDIKGYEGLYQVSSFGRVYSFPREWKTGVSVGKHSGKILKTSKNTKNGEIVGLRKNNKRKSIRIHQLVAEAFLNHIIDGHRFVVDHINNNPLDNRLENLQIVTQRFNCSKDKKGFSSIHTGVSWDKFRNKWVSFIMIDGKRKNLGRFCFELDASQAYQTALQNISNESRI